MKLLIGIGNPGSKYVHTRHNAGVRFAEHFNNHDFKILISSEFMNSSGIFVKSKVDYFDVELDDLYVAHDDLDLPLGEFKIQKGVGPKVHNGINSINHALGNINYWRIRIGIDNREPESRIKGEKYVLENFTKEEFEIIEKVFEKINEELN